MKENGTYHDGLESNNLPESLRENPFGMPKNYFSDLESKIIMQVNLIECKEKPHFEVPDGYFDSLPDFIIGRIAENSLRTQIATDGFDAPEDYSTRLTESIFNRISEQKLKATLSSDGFSLPATDYAETLENKIFTRIAEQKLKETVPMDGFSVPVDYHSELTDNILARVTEEKLKLTVPSTDFNVPPQYFDTLSENIMATIQASESHTLIHQIGRKRTWYSRYAVAASFVAMLSIGGYLGYQYQDDVNSDENMAEKQLAQHLSEIPKQEIINYLAASGSGDDIVYMVQYTDEANLPTQGFGSNISKQEIEDYLNYTL
ncbi:hypothetical protein HX021_10565 [Sphingobacterium sp. N143]|uniref:hypothetical protein n=1 Tax=Sphingobacterium sp. N143 TaxID=2746727 RepID=UPI0025783558|nr:hypothetical protein [Sphingobacterium sp. N143]MDM1294729.1 hypothetical protein [Sphingobacterium sp. N143]